MRNRARKNYVIYVLMLLLFGGLIYVAIEEGDRFSHYAINAHNVAQGDPFSLFLLHLRGQNFIILHFCGQNNCFLSALHLSLYIS